jgi:hypothetical protein
MTAAEWNKTPYANTEARDTEATIIRLLDKYGVKEHTISSFTGRNKRPAWGIRFSIKGQSYRIALEVLDAPRIPEEKLKTQVKRVIFHFLKSTLEMTNVFMPVEQVLFAFLELNSNVTVFEMAMPRLAQLAQTLTTPALPPAE